MARKKTSPSAELGKASISDEAAEREHAAAEKRLEAAKMRAQARELDNEDGQDDPDSQEPPRERFAPSLDGLDPEVRAQLLGEMPPEEPAEPAPSPIPEVPLTKMEKILKGLNGDGKFVVHKMVAGNPMKVGVHDINDYPDLMDSIAHEHGGGTFRIRFMNPKGEWVGQETLTFDPKSYGKESPSSSSDLMMVRMMEQMQSREERLQLQLQAMQTQQHSMMLEIIKSSGSHRERTAEEVVSLMKATRDLSGDRDKESPIESVKGILEVVAMLNNSGVGEPPNPVSLAIDKAFQLAGPLLGAWAARLGAGVESPRPGAAGAPTAPVQLGAPVQPAPLSLPDPRQAAASAEPNSPVQAPVNLPGTVPQRPNPALKNYATSLLAAASAGQSPEKVAEMVVIAVPEEELDNLFELVSDPSFVGQMLATEPRLMPYQGWLVTLSNSIKSNLTEEPSSDSPPSAVPPASDVQAVPAPLADYVSLRGTSTSSAGLTAKVGEQGNGPPC